LKSSSSASFSKYQEEMERDELNFDSYATGNADIASSTSINSNMNYENLPNHHPQHNNNNNNNNNGHSQPHVNISGMIFKHYSPTPNLQGYRMNSIGQLPSNGISSSTDTFPHLNYLSDSNLPVNSPVVSSISPLSIIVNPSDSMHFPGIRHHGSQLLSVHMTQDTSPLISTFEQFDRKQSEEQHPIANANLEPINVSVKQGEPIDINGEMYNDRGYKICGHLNQHRKPCQRIGKCPFHWKLKEDENASSKLNATRKSLSSDTPTSVTFQESSVNITSNEGQSAQQFNSPVPLINPQRSTPIKKGPFKQGWSKEEHLLFLKGLMQHGKGAWKEISQIVGTRTPTQIQSHAQKYFLRQKQRVKNKRSIHDITLDTLSNEHNKIEEENNNCFSEDESKIAIKEVSKSPSNGITNGSTSSISLPSFSPISPEDHLKLQNAIQQQNFEKISALLPNIDPSIVMQIVALNSINALNGPNGSIQPAQQHSTGQDMAVNGESIQRMSAKRRKT